MLFPKSVFLLHHFFLISDTLNHLDLWVRKGVAGHKINKPFILGSDASGVIEKSNSSTPIFEGIDKISPLSEKFMYEKKYLDVIKPIKIGSDKTLKI